MAESNSTSVLLRCSKCKLEKPTNEFRARPERKRGYQSRCRVCESEAAKTPDRREKSNQRSYEFRMRLKSKDYKEYRRRERESNLTRNYGIGQAEYEQMLAAQSGKCAICGGPPGGTRWMRDDGGEKREQRFSVDHCHETGRIRALLCGRCNRGIGDFKDNPELMRKAAEYIVRYAKEEATPTTEDA